MKMNKVYIVFFWGGNFKYIKGVYKNHEDAINCVSEYATLLKEEGIECRIEVCEADLCCAPELFRSPVPVGCTSSDLYNDPIWVSCRQSSCTEIMRWPEKQKQYFLKKLEELRFAMETEDE